VVPVLDGMGDVNCFIWSAASMAAQAGWID